jgi:integrase
MGSWRHPHLETQKTLFAELRSLSHDSDMQLSHSATTTLAICGLTRLTGARTIELIDARPHNFNFTQELYTVSGKRNWAHGEARVLPLAIPALVHQAIDMTRTHKTSELLPAFTLWWQGHLQQAQPAMIDHTLQIAGKRRGLMPDEIPAAYAFRHAFRSDGLERGLSHHDLTTLMGHSGDGREPFSPYNAEFRFEAMIARVRLVIAAMVRDLGLGEA